MAAAKKNPKAEFARALGSELQASLQGRPGCGKALAALAKVGGGGQDMAAIVAELQAIEPELRAAIADAKEHDPELARGLSKLADVPACADLFDTNKPDELAAFEAFALEKLEFLRARI